MKLCAFRWLILRPQILNVRSQNQIRGKLPFSKNYGLQNSTTIVHRMTSRIAPGELLLVMLIYHLREYLRARQVISQINTWHG